MKRNNKRKAHNLSSNMKIFLNAYFYQQFMFDMSSFSFRSIDIVLKQTLLPAISSNNTSKAINRKHTF